MKTRIIIVVTLSFSFASSKSVKMSDNQIPAVESATIGGFALEDKL
jgi:hypothetical protein